MPSRTNTSSQIELALKGADATSRPKGYLTETTNLRCGLPPIRIKVERRRECARSQLWVFCDVGLNRACENMVG
jgi:hypothetical protein